MTTGNTAELQLATFILCGGRYALDITRIKEIVRVPRLTRVPKAPAHVAGMTNLRGHIIPVLDTRLRLGMPPREPDAASRVVVVQGQTGDVGLLVDGVAEILRLPAANFTMADELRTSAASRSVAGIGRLGDTLLLLLDLDEVLSGDEAPPVAVAAHEKAPAATPAPDATQRTPSRPRLRLAA